MRYALYSADEWMFNEDFRERKIPMEIDMALGGHGGFQVLLEKETLAQVKVLCDAPEIKAEIFALLDVGVNENTSPALMTTTDYESCKSFVTKKAPFRVYDALKPIERMPSFKALYVRLFAPHNAKTGTFAGDLVLTDEEGETRISFSVSVYGALVPSMEKSKLGFLNFCSYENIAKQHNVPMDSQEYWDIFRSYVRQQLSMRSTHILLPEGKMIYDKAGHAVGADFSFCERAARIALDEGAKWVCGGHVAHWHEWNEESYYLAWADDISATDAKGYAQLRIYFSEWARVIKRNGWEGRVAQCLADEPQTYNDKTYRMLSGIFRKFLPGVPIIDAVETTELYGGIDVWVPKEDTYEKHREAFDSVHVLGETMWFYTCAFPAGPSMNRSMDLPLLVSREILWRGAGYGLEGYLHWGLNYYLGDDIMNSACCPHKGELLPAGDAHIVYPDGKYVLASMRLEAQRAGIEDYELLWQLRKKHPQKAEELINRACPSFKEYERDAKAFAAIRRELLRSMED
jgi:hypothetical protein